MIEQVEPCDDDGDGDDERVVLPDRVRIVIDRRGDGTCEFDYQETFADEEVARRTRDLLVLAFTRLSGGVATVSGEGSEIRIHAESMPTVQVGNALIGEFLMWGSLGSMRLREFIGMALVSGLRAGGVEAQP